MISNAEILSKIKTALKEIYYIRYIFLYKHCRIELGFSKSESRNKSISAIKDLIERQDKIKSFLSEKGFDLQTILEEIL